MARLFIAEKPSLAKAPGKKHWVCSSGRDVCAAIFSDKSGKPDFSLNRKNTVKTKQKSSL